MEGSLADRRRALFKGGAAYVAGMFITYLLIGFGLMGFAGALRQDHIGTKGAMVPQLGVAYEPLFLYEIGLALVIFALLWSLRSRLHVGGQLFATYLALYALGKFALSFLRTETIWVAGLREAQLLSVVALLVAALWAWNARQRPLGALVRAGK